MIIAVVGFHDSTITQRAACFRIIYGFSFLFLPLFMRIFDVYKGQVPSTIFTIPLFFIVVPSFNFLMTLHGEPLVKDSSISNWRFSISAFLLGKQFFEPSPISPKISYRVFRGLLGIFMLVLGLLYFVLMLPLVALEILTSRARSIRGTGPYAPAQFQ